MSYGFMGKNGVLMCASAGKDVSGKVYILCNSLDMEYNSYYVGDGVRTEL